MTWFVPAQLRARVPVSKGVIKIAVIGRDREVTRALRAAGFSVRRSIEGCVAAVNLDGAVPGVMAAMKEAGIWRLIHVSAAPDRAEEIVRDSDLDWTILRSPSGEAVVAALLDLGTERRIVAPGVAIV